MLSAEGSSALACRRLRVRELPPEVSALDVAQAEGHPSFTEALALSLLDSGVVTVADGECRPGPDPSRAAGIPRTIEGVITSRIDRLPTEHQLPLKAASVIGRVFALSDLADVHPVAEQRARQGERVEHLRERQFILVEQPDPDRACSFRHVITQPVAYNLLLSSQRRELHAAVAGWFERTRADALAARYSLLAHHWKKAEVWPKAAGSRRCPTPSGGAGLEEGGGLAEGGGGTWIGQADVEAWVSLLTGTCRCGVGRWSRAQAAGDRAAETSRRIVHRRYLDLSRSARRCGKGVMARRIVPRRYLDLSQSLLMVNAFRRGNMRGLLEQGELLSTESERTGSLQARRWGGTGLGIAQNGIFL